MAAHHNLLVLPTIRCCSANSCGALLAISLQSQLHIMDGLETFVGIFREAGPAPGGSALAATLGALR